MIEDIVTETIYVWRPPCLVSTISYLDLKYISSANYNMNRLLSYSIQARDLEVNGGVWRGETTDVGYDTFPNGWGVLQYNEADHLNRFVFT